MPQCSQHACLAVVSFLLGCLVTPHLSLEYQPEEGAEGRGRDGVEGEGGSGGRGREWRGRGREGVEGEGEGEGEGGREGQRERKDREGGREGGRWQATDCTIQCMQHKQIQIVSNS